MTLWRRWRPPGSGQIAQVRDAVRPALTDWSTEWFGHGIRVQIADEAADTGALASPDRAVDSGADSRSANPAPANQPCPILAITAIGSAPAALATAALAAEAGARAGSPLALALLQDIEQRMLRDLRQRLARALRLDDADAQSLPTRGQQVDIRAFVAQSTGRATGVLIRVDAGALPRRPRIGRPLDGALSDRWEALGPEPIAVGVRIGHSRVAALDVVQLKPGDVLLADRGIDEPIEINLGDRRLGWGYPCRVGNRKAVQLSLEAQEAREDGKR